MLTPEKTTSLSIIEETVLATGIATVMNGASHIQTRAYKSYSYSETKEMSFVSNGLADLLTQASGTLNLGWDAAFLEDISSKNNQNVFRVPEGYAHCIPVCHFTGSSNIATGIYVGVKILVLLLKENCTGLLEIQGTSPNHPFLKLMDFEDYRTVTYLTDDDPLTRAYHLCAEQTSDMLYCMGADYIAFIPFYLSYAQPDLLTDIKVFPQFTNNTLYNNQNNDIPTITNHNHRKLFMERQNNFSVYDWPVVSFS